MVVATVIPRFPLLVAALRTRRPLDVPVALGPAPGDPQVVGLSSPPAHEQGVVPGLRVGEALARCPSLELISPDPAAVAEAAERLVVRLEDLGARVEHVAPGTTCFSADGLVRLHGGLDRLMRRVRAALPVGAGGGVGAAPGRFAAISVASMAELGDLPVVGADRIAEVLAPLPLDRLPLPHDQVTALRELGVRTIGRMAALPRAAVLDRLGREGVTAWRLARGEGDDAPRPRRPPHALTAEFHFPEPVGARSAIHAAARLMFGELTAAARGQGRALRVVTLRARLSGEGSFERSITLREPTADPQRLALAALPAFDEIAAPVESLWVRADAMGPLGGRQLTAIATGTEERRRRAGDAARQVRAAQGPEGIMRLIEIEPWSRRLEQRWALVPYDASDHLTR